MLRRPPPLVLLVLGIALVLAAFALDSVNGTEGTALGSMPAPATPVAAAPTSNPSPSPSATLVVPPTATVLPDRTTCGAVEGTSYRSDAERAWYLANCTS